MRFIALITPMNLMRVCPLIQEVYCQKLASKSNL